MSSSWYIRLVGVIFLLFLYPSGDIRAARSISIQVSGESFAVDEPFTLTASASGFSDGEVLHVKGAFFVPGSTNYFGYSRVSDRAWVENIQSASHQPEVVIGIWDSTLGVKGDSSDSGYQGEGEYLIKLGYYYLTASGTLSPVQWSINALPVVLREPIATHTPTPTLSATHTPTTRPTNTPSPTMVPKPTAVFIKYTPTPLSKSFTAATVSSDILGIHTGSPSGVKNRQHNPPEKGVILPRSVFALLFIGIGLAIAAFALSVQKISVWKRLQE